MGVMGYSIQEELGASQSHPLIEKDVVVENLAVMRDTVSPRESEDSFQRFQPICSFNKNLERVGLPWWSSG